MSELTDVLYRTNKSIRDACDELGIQYSEDDLEDLSRCDNCNIWYRDYELMLDVDGLNTCRWCDENYAIL